MRVEVHVRGRLGTDLLDVLGDLEAHTVPRHTVLLLGDGARTEALVHLLDDLERAGVEVDRILPCGDRPVA